MTTYAGKDGVVKLGSNAVGELKSWEIESTMRPIDDSQLTDTWDTHLAGPQGWRGRAACHWDPDDTNGQVALTIGASVTLNMYPEGASSGDSYFSGTASVTRIMRQASREGTVEAEFEFQGNGALSITAVT